MNDKKSKWDSNRFTEIDEEEATSQSEASDDVQEAEESASHEIDIHEMDPDEMKEKIEELEKEIKTSHEQVIRAKAEVQNIQRRSKTDVEKAHKFGIEKFAKELLNVIDTLEKALEVETAENESAKSIYEGVQLTLDMFLKICEKFELKQIDPLGEPFDPSFHEALSTQPNADAEPNTVMMVVQKGYVLHGRVIRPAKVILSAAA